ncbi:hypothetical protein FOA52_003201 [Chlamydomonas sp. UWO 241]|nr:hypothetical protein FOA52_003201 [Chlamydomonas sp. UWO 241]
MDLNIAEMFATPKAGGNRKKRGRQQDSKTQINAIDAVLGKLCRTFLQCTFNMAVLLSAVIGMELVLSLIVTSMALPSGVLGVVTSLPDAVVQDDLFTCVGTLRPYIHRDVGYGQNSIYGLFVKIIISFIKRATGDADWYWKPPSGDTAVVYMAMSADQKSLIDVFETVIDERHKKIKVVVGVGESYALSGCILKRMRGISRGFRVCTELEWYILILITLMTEFAKRKGKFEALNQFVSVSSNSKILNVANYKDDDLVKTDMYNLLNNLDYIDTDYHVATHIINLMNSDFKKCAW